MNPIKRRAFTFILTNEMKAFIQSFTAVRIGFILPITEVLFSLNSDQYRKSFLL
jgi:hypothetical protein